MIIAFQIWVDSLKTTLAVDKNLKSTFPVFQNFGQTISLDWKLELRWNFDQNTNISSEICQKILVVTKTKLIARLMSKCLWCDWKRYRRAKEISSPFSCSPVTREYSWKKTCIEKKKKKMMAINDIIYGFLVFNKIS